MCDGVDYRTKLKIIKMENEVKLTTEQKNEMLYKAIDALIDVADDLGINSHEIKNVWVTKLRSEIELDD